MSKIEKPKIVLKKALKFNTCEHNAHKIFQYVKKCVTIIFSVKNHFRKIRCRFVNAVNGFCGTLFGG
jgi:hypothetical protein